MNHLATETSPYLRQHAGNPVHWHPWNTAALERARRENKPILLSIGYSACHWCHVMAHESFEDAATAGLMNEHFINIKVDREERPDLDRIYQIAHQMLAQRPGGWPLTMFLSPEDLRPFFGGTYFPKESRQGMPAFKDILTRVDTYYRQHPAEVRQQNAALGEAFATLYPPPTTEDLSIAPLQQARSVLNDEFDGRWGGFGAAPKFPHVPSLEFLLRYWQQTAQDAKPVRPMAAFKIFKKKDENEPDLHALYMATLSLKRMGEGGLFDQLGGGFARYSVDRYWMIPHFEKMLYDNAQLLALYAQTFIATGDRFYADIAHATAEWTLREMQAPEGGYYSSIDADSEGHEGKFYVWDAAQIERMLTPEEYRLFAKRYGLDRAANFEGKWHLHTHESLEQLASATGSSGEELEALLDSARRKLFAARAERIAPGRDEKILTSWNALTIRGMSIAARCLREPRYLESAERALDFIRKNLWRDGRLLVTAKDGKAHLPAYLDDYVFLADAILELQQCRWRSDEFNFAVALMEIVLQRFANSSAATPQPGQTNQPAVSGGFFFTADDHEHLMHRPLNFGDDATPNGNAVAARVLNRLGLLLGETRYLKAAEDCLRAGYAPLQRYPQGHGSLLIALDEYLHPLETIIVRGAQQDSAAAAEATRWSEDLAAMYAPRRAVYVIPADATGLPNALADKPAAADTLAYVCRGSSCREPVNVFAGLLQQLRE